MCFSLGDYQMMAFSKALNLFFEDVASKSGFFEFIEDSLLQFAGLALLNLLLLFFLFLLFDLFCLYGLLLR